MNVAVAVFKFSDSPQISWSNKLSIESEIKARPPDKSVYWKTIFFISHPKHMLWVLKRTVSMRRFF